MFIRNQWYGAVWSKDFGGDPLGLRILDQPIVLFRTDDGEISVLDDLCPHRFVPLRLGKVVHGDRLRCAYHGLEFDRTGACVHNPHTKGRIPPAAKVKSYTALERYGMVWVWLGDAEPDPALLPDLTPLDADGAPPESGPHYVPTGGRFSLVMKANYRLIGENLLDLSHACILHDTLLGNLEMADADLEVEETPTGFIVRRLATDTVLPKLFQLISGKESGDSWADMELVGPSCFLNHLGISDAGQGRGHGAGLFGVNILTPIDANTTLYHVDGALIDPPERRPEDHARIGREMGSMANYAFTQQDQVTLEAQQLAMSDPALDTSRPAMFDIDLGSARYTRWLQALEAADRQGETAKLATAPRPS
jgi:phenylpropionate dioxygenase-like ring-hydroxylating dioxygenase large terminal subunit